MSLEHRINVLQKNVMCTITDFNKGIEYLERLLYNSERNTPGTQCMYADTGDIIIGRKKTKTTDLNSRILIGYCPDRYVQDDITDFYESEDIIRIGVDFNDEDNEGWGLSRSFLQPGSIAIGYNASVSPEDYKTGEHTISIGSRALYKNLYDEHNIAIGSKVGYGYNRLGMGNIIIGPEACSNTNIGHRTIAIGYRVARDIADMIENDVIVIGKDAGASCYKVYSQSINIGTSVGCNSSGLFSDSINIGTRVLGDRDRNIEIYNSKSIAIGSEALYKGFQDTAAIAIGPMVLQNATQLAGAIVIGTSTLNALNREEGGGSSIQANNAIAIGPYVLKSGQQDENAIAIGSSTCDGTMTTSRQGVAAIAIGHETCKGCIQENSAIALGYKVFQNDDGCRQGIGAIAIGSNIATEQGAFQENYAIMLGSSPNIKQNTGAVAIGWYTHNNSTQGKNGVSIGRDAGFSAGNDGGIGEGGILIGRSVCQDVSKMGSGTISIGTRACFSNSDYRYHMDNTISIGMEAAAYAIQSENTIAIGSQAIQWGFQQKDAIAIGYKAGINVDQSEGAILIGQDAFTSAVWYPPKQEAMTLAIGKNIGSSTSGGIVQKRGALAIGTNAISNGTQGSYSIAIGANAGVGGQHKNSIVISALGTDFTSSREGGLFIKPIRADTGGDGKVRVMYNQESGELFTTSEPPVNRAKDDGSPDFHADGLIVKGNVKGSINIYGQLDGTKIGRGGLIMTNKIGLRNPKVVSGGGDPNIKGLVIDINSGEIKYRN